MNKVDQKLTERAPAPRLLDLQGASKYLGVKARTLRDRVNGVKARMVTQKNKDQKVRKYYRAAILKEIPVVRIGRLLYFDRP